MLLVILCAWLSQAAPAAQQPPELLLLSRWVRSVERHEPARADVEAATIAVWPRNDLRTTIETLGACTMRCSERSADDRTRTGGNAATARPRSRRRASSASPKTRRSAGTSIGC